MGSLTPYAVVVAFAILIDRMDVTVEERMLADKAGFSERFIQRYGETRGKLLAQNIEQELENTLGGQNHSAAQVIVRLKPGLELNEES